MTSIPSGLPVEAAAARAGADARAKTKSLKQLSS